MGSQQLLLILLGLILVGLAIAVGLSLSSSHTADSNRDAIIADLVDLSADALRYRQTPAARAGGAGLYTGYQIPASLRSNENGSYSLVGVSPDQVTFLATSSQGFGTIQGVFGPDGRITGPYNLTGRFRQ